MTRLSSMCDLPEGQSGNVATGCFTKTGHASGLGIGLTVATRTTKCALAGWDVELEVARRDGHVEKLRSTPSPISLPWRMRRSWRPYERTTARSSGRATQMRSTHSRSGLLRIDRCSRADRSLSPIFDPRSSHAKDSVAIYRGTSPSSDRRARGRGGTARLGLGLALFTDSFLRMGNLLDRREAASDYGIMAVGMVFLLSMGEIDLSRSGVW